MRVCHMSPLVGAAMFVSMMSVPWAAGAVEQITVTGERLTPTAPGIESARADAARVPGGSSIVGREEYADGRASTLLDVLALTPGVFIQPRFGAEEARLSIRGSGLQRTFHLRGIYLLQDGVPITLADGSGDFQTIEPMALAYTEVLRGANALRYGASTLGGSINFVSPSGHDGLGWRPRLETGAFGYRRGFVSFGWEQPHARGGARTGSDATGLDDYFLAASGYGQDGYRQWSRQSAARLSGNFAWRWSEALESRFFLTALHSDSQLPGALTRAQLRDDPTAANAGNLAGRQKRDYDLYRFANRTVYQVGDHFLELTLGYSYKDLWHPIFQVLQQRSHDYLAGVSYTGQWTWGGRDNRLTAGLAPAWSDLQDDRFVNVGGQRGARTGESLQRSANLTAYAENHLSLTPRWTLVAGGQWTQARRRYDDRFLTNGDQSLDATYTRLSPKLGFLWQPTPQWTVFGNVSGSFEPPSFGELSGGPGVDLLDAQHARTLELGTRGNGTVWQWDLAVYSAEVRNELLSLNSPTGDPLGTVNAPRTRHRGVEGGLAIALARTVSWRTSVLLNDFRFERNRTYGDNPLPGLPRQIYRTELGWEFQPSYTVTVSGEWVPRRYAVDMANSWFADPYALIGAKCSHTVRRGISWFVEGRNLADRRYAASTGVVADARGQDIAQFLPGDGRSVYAGIEWRTK